MYCACHATGDSALRLPRTRPRAQQLHQEALCTAPATPQAGAGQRRAAGQRRPRAPQLRQGALCTARRPRAPQLLQEACHVHCTCHARGSRRPPATTRAATPPGGSVHAPATRESGDHARRSSSRLCVLRLPRESQRHARHSSSRRLYLLRLPRDRQPRASGDHARRSSSRRLCALHLPRERQPRASGDHARGNSSRRLCARACHGRGSRVPAATTRAAAPPGGSVYYACHARW